MTEASSSADAFVSDVRQRVEDACESGLHCAEAVVTALAQAQGIESGLIPRIATPFCGGLSRTHGPCGALTGAAMALGMALGRDDGRRSEMPAYAATQELVRRFEREFGARDCDQLLGCDIDTPDGEAAFQAQGLYARCERYTVRAAELAAALVARHKD